jgi:hypothetical protein
LGGAERDEEVVGEGPMIFAFAEVFLVADAVAEWSQPLSTAGPRIYLPKQHWSFRWPLTREGAQTGL